MADAFWTQGSEISSLKEDVAAVRVSAFFERRVAGKIETLQMVQSHVQTVHAFRWPGQLMLQTQIAQTSSFYLGPK